MRIREVLILLVTTFGILLAQFLGVPLPILQQTIVFLLAIILLLLTSLAIPRMQHLMLKHGKWYFFFIAVLLIQLLTVTTGGLASPYVILVHLAFFGISFLFSFSTALFFLVFTVTIVVAQRVINPAMMDVDPENIGVVFLYGASFITVIPIAYILTKQYRINDHISKTLTKQIKIEESILTNLDELVIVADATGKILSLNDAVERILHKSRSELLQSSLFEVLLIKNEKGMLINDTSLFQKKEPYTLSNISLLTSFGMIKANMHIKPIELIEEEQSQVSIIISLLTGKEQIASKSILTFQEAIAKHDAMLENLKKKLEKRGEQDLKHEAIMIKKSEDDIEMAREAGSSIHEKKIPIDLASLCRQLAIQHGEFAEVFGVITDFSFVNFTEQDVAPLISGQAAITPDQLTGPFFTAPCDVKYVSILLQKILDINVLVASKASDKTVRMTIERIGPGDILIKVMCKNSFLTPDDLPKLFTPYYVGISEKNNLDLGSGLEGFIAQAIGSQLHLPVQINLTKDMARLVFMVMVTKGKPTLASLASEQKIVSSKSSLT